VNAPEIVRVASARRGFSTLETLIALSLFSVVLLAQGGLFMLAITSGTAAESASIATNLARARLEQLRALPASELAGQDGVNSVEQVPPGRGRSYTIRTAVTPDDTEFLDLTVTVTWQVVFGSACAAGGPGPECRGSLVTRTRTLQTRIHREDVP
jgi:Tfp pilus assembly protein PilV